MRKIIKTKQPKARPKQAVEKENYRDSLPNSIKIGYAQYTFDFWPDTFATTEEAQGEFFQVAHKIGLKESTIPSVAGVNTLLHEVLHGVVYQWALDLGDKEEHTVNTLSNGLTTVFVDNPWLVDYIKKRIKNKWLLVAIPFLFFLVKGLIWLAIFYGLWDYITK